MTGRRAASPMLFEVGFNKSATRSFTRLMKDHGLVTHHWLGGDLARDLLKSLHNGHKPFSNYPGQVFSDIMLANQNIWFEGRVAFRELDKWFPGAVFVVLDRQVDEWIESRFAHAGGLLAKFYRQVYNLEDNNAVAREWRQSHQNHSVALENYFGLEGISSNGSRLIRISLSDPNFMSLEDALGIHIDHSLWQVFGARQK